MKRGARLRAREAHEMQRTLTVFLCAAGGALAVAIIKALVVSGFDTLPPVKVLVFAASMFGLLATLLDWSLLRQLRRSATIKPERVGVREDRPQHGDATLPSPPVPRSDLIIEQARLRPIVFREICSPSTATGLSFYGGVPVGPANLAWPRGRN